MLSSIETINRIFEAGIAITALSLFLRALSFNLRDRISRAFAIILACVMISFTGEAVAGVLTQATSLEVWLRLQWVGTLFLPAAYLHFSDALLETTGRPSRAAYLRTKCSTSSGTSSGRSRSGGRVTVTTLRR